MKNGEIIKQLKYSKTYFFNEGDFAINTCVYFELIDSEERYIYVAGSEIWKIETEKKA